MRGEPCFYSTGLLAPPRPPSTLPDPAEVRARLRALIAKARAADASPWSDRDAAMWATVFPQMTCWLPEPEAIELRATFRAELSRLAPHVAWNDAPWKAALPA